MFWRVLADTVVIVHFSFILFVILGGLLALRWPKAVWAHLPVLMYGILIEFIGWTCFLTPLENYFRRQAGQAGYPETFTEHYILPLIYPGGLTKTLTTTLGIALILFNLLVYGWVIARTRRRKHAA